MTLLWELLFPGIFWSLVVLSGASAVFNLILIFNLRLANRIRAWFDRSYSIRKPMKPLEISRDSDQWFFNHRYLVGTFITLASIYLVYFFLLGFEVDKFVRAVSLTQGETIVLDFVSHALQIGFPILGVGCILVGIGLVFNPDRVMKVNAYLNRWISTRQPLQKIKVDIISFDDKILQYNVLFGLVFLVFSLMLMTFSLMMLYY